MTAQQLRIINKEIEDFKNKSIQVVPGLYFNQYQTIEKIYFYYHSKFITGDIDDEGDRKYFFNINKNPCKVYSKAIDFDTKNVRLLSVGGGNPQKTWFMERDVKYWMRDKQFGKTLNRTFRELPIFGSVVLKIVDGTPEFVDLRNFVVEPAADCLDSSNYIIEVHNYTTADFRAAAKKMNWDKSKVTETIQKFHEMQNTSHIRVYERYGDIATVDAKGETTYAYKRIFHADVGVDEFDNYGNLTVEKTGVELASDEWDGHPYWDIHGEKLPGRWLGIGVVETLFEPQIALNESTNLQAKTASWAALRVFQTRDPAINRNLLTDVRNGEVLNTDSEITQIDMSDRNLSFFVENDRKWLANRDENTFSYDVVQGERLPAGTPLGSAQIAAAQTLSYFEQIQENVAMDFKEMLYEVIIPHFEKERTAKHVLRLVGSDLDDYVSMVKNELAFKEILRMALDNHAGGKFFPTSQDLDTVLVGIEESIKRGKEHLLDIPKGFYEDVKYDVDIDITGESVDTRVRYATKFAIIQAITADPTMTTDPVKRKFLFSMAEDGGVNLNDFFDVEATPDTLPTPGRAGGGVSAPALGNRIAGQTTTTV